MTPVEAVINEVRLLFHQAAKAGESLHADEPVTIAMRAVLESLDRDGPATVPAIARARGVTRQHIQMQVNALLELGLVELQDNPAHKRSSRVAATAAGTRVIRRMRKREQEFLQRRKMKIKRSDLETTVATLRALRRHLQEEEV